MHGALWYTSLVTWQLHHFSGLQRIGFKFLLESLAEWGFKTVSKSQEENSTSTICKMKGTYSQPHSLEPSGFMQVRNIENTYLSKLHRWDRQGNASFENPSESYWWHQAISNLEVLIGYIWFDTPAVGFSCLHSQRYIQVFYPNIVWCKLHTQPSETGTETQESPSQASVIGYRGMCTHLSSLWPNSFNYFQGSSTTSMGRVAYSIVLLLEHSPGRQKMLEQITSRWRDNGNSSYILDDCITYQTLCKKGDHFLLQSQFFN